MFPGIENRLLRYAVAVAEELHFSRAAQKLHVSQPSLSKQIKELEAVLGAKLFDRTRHKVRLTEAGAVFVPEAKQALLHGELAVKLVKAISRPRSFALGYSPYVSHALVSSVRALFASRFADIRVSFTNEFAAKQLEMVRSGDLEAGLVTLPVAAEPLAVEPLLTEALSVALPEKHALRRLRTVRLRDLHGLPMIAVTKELCPQLHERIRSAFVRERFQPMVGQEVITLDEAISMIVEGQGFTFVHECDHHLRHPGVIFKPLYGQPLSLESGIVYRPDGASPIVHALIAALSNRKEPGVVKPIATSLIA